MAALTFVVGTRDRWQFLATLLGSLETQTVKDFKVIVCDEGESNNQKDTLWVMETHPQLDMQRLVSPWAQDWHYTVKNQAVDVVDTKWVCFPQDDWYYMPMFVEKMLNLPSHVQLVACDWIHTTKSRIMRYQPVRPEIGQVSIGNFMITKDLLNQIGRFAQTDGLADGRMIVKANAESLMFRVQEPLAVSN